jgi:hypothetical protein
VFRQKLGVHGHDGRNVAAEHAAPFTFFDVLAMIGTRHGFGGPFLLEKGAGEAVLGES